MFKIACLKQCLFRTGKFEKEDKLKVTKVASLDQVIFKYSGLKDRFGRIYQTIYLLSCDKLDSCL